VPLYPWVVQRGDLALSERSGAVLAIAPGEWFDGCPVVREEQVSGGLHLCIDAYLDPSSGRALAVDVHPHGSGRTFSTAPGRWTGALARHEGSGRDR
jgi:N-methylhydantoinase B